MKNKQISNIIKYVLPSVIGQVCFFLFTIIDGIFVGRGIGENALGAVNIVLPFLMVINAFFMLITVGGVAVTAVRLGRNDVNGANQAFMHALSLMLVLGLFLTLVGTLFTKPLGYLFGANETYIGYVCTYMKYYSIFLIPSSLCILFQFFCRNDGSPLLVMISVIVGTLLNVFLDWLFVFPFKQGLKGAAVATGISQTVSFLIMISHFIFKKGQLRIQKFKFDKKVIMKIFLRGFPETIAQFAAPVLTVCINRVLIKNYGEIAVNSYSIINYVTSFAVAIFFGVSEGVQPLFGNSYGEKNDINLKYYFKFAVAINFFSSVAVYITVLFIGKPICNLFNAEQATLNYTLKVIPLFSSGFIIMSLNTIISSYLYSTKRTKEAVIINFLRSFVFTIFSTLLLTFIFGKEIIWFSFLICEILSVIVSFVLLKNSEKNGIIYH